MNRLAILSPVLLILFCLSPTMAGEPIPEIGPAGETVRLLTGFGFTEGPVDDGEGHVYFTDIPNAKILRIDAQGELTVFTDDSHHANGLMLNAAGEMVACEMDGQVVAWNRTTKSRRTLASGYQGKRFNAPNDLVIDRSGGIYFTDPHYRAPEPLPQGTMGVYYIRPDGTVSRVIESLPAPNGIILSVDEKTLYVFPSGAPVMRAYPVLEPGQLGEGRDFCQLQQPEEGGLRGADGVTIDTRGNLYITSQLGIQVVSPEGNVLGILELPEPPANVTFGGPDRKTLYITARTSLYAIPMHATGHRFAQPARP